MPLRQAGGALAACMSSIVGYVISRTGKVHRDLAALEKKMEKREKEVVELLMPSCTSRQFVLHDFTQRDVSIVDLQ